jgi:hypothetical protein
VFFLQKQNENLNFMKNDKLQKNKNENQHSYKTLVENFPRDRK